MQGRYILLSLMMSVPMECHVVMFVIIDCSILFVLNLCSSMCHNVRRFNDAAMYRKPTATVLRITK